MFCCYYMWVDERGEEGTYLGFGFIELQGQWSSSVRVYVVKIVKEPFP